jgi:hypothetical protein
VVVVAQQGERSRESENNQGETTGLFFVESVDTDTKGFKKKEKMANEEVRVRVKGKRGGCR